MARYFVHSASRGTSDLLAVIESDVILVDSHNLCCVEHDHDCAVVLLPHLGGLFVIQWVLDFLHWDLLLFLRDKGFDFTGYFASVKVDRKVCEPGAHSINVAL